MTVQSTTPDLSISFAGLKLQTPLVLLSGCVGFGEEYTRIEGFSNSHVGAVILKGTTVEPRMGNAPHRVYETPSGMLNAIGLQNPGTRYDVLVKSLAWQKIGATSRKQAHHLPYNRFLCHSE
ncbi:MAG: hypothetical protein Q9M14_06385 [Mariprofundaceae bacterium]|nr:hypothetical protein [Mariprofundaceae bacterium]